LAQDNNLHTSMPLVQDPREPKYLSRKISSNKFEEMIARLLMEMHTHHYNIITSMVNTSIGI